jgi:hypothetical protein
VRINDLGFDRVPLLWTFDGERLDVRQDLLPSLPSPSWRCLMPGDLDGDGDLDWVASSWVGPTAVIRNDSVTGHWISVALDGPPGNRDGLGASIVVQAGERSWRTTLGAGAEGVATSLEPGFHVGLGASTRVDRVTVRWPDGSVTATGALPADGSHRVAWADGG